MPSINDISLAAGSLSVGVKNGIFAHPTWDIILVVVFIAAAFFYAIIAGKGKIITGIIVSYIAVTLWRVLPMDALVDNIGDGERFAIKVTLFFALFIALFVLMEKSSVIAQVKSSRDKMSALAKTFFLSSFQVGMFLNIIFSFLQQKGAFEISPLIAFLFYSKYSSLFWFVLPLAALLLCCGKKDK